MVVTDYSCNTVTRLEQNPETIYKFLLDPISIDFSFWDDLITYGIEFFKSAIIKQTNPLYNSPSLLKPTKSPAKYTSHFSKYILLNIRHTSLEIISSFLKVCAHLIVSIVPLLILCNNHIGVNGKSSSSIRYD